MNFGWKKAIWPGDVSGAVEHQVGLRRRRLLHVLEEVGEMESTQTLSDETCSGHRWTQFELEQVLNI
ncbi:hypothetical protein V6N13_053700, partial [Hibiscus sabdariffa]